MSVRYKCKDCGAANDVYIFNVTACWEAERQDWDVVPNDKESDKQCGNCNSWEIEMYEGE
jgi:hypothetical protein